MLHGGASRESTRAGVLVPNQCQLPPVLGADAVGGQAPG